MAAKKIVAPAKTVAQTSEVAIKKVTERTVRALKGQSLLSLQSKKRMNSLFVVNMHKNHNVMVEVSGTTVLVPDTWIPYDLSTHAEPHNFLQSASFRSLISPTATRGPLLKVVDSKTALYILESQEADVERQRLRMIQEEVKPITKTVKRTVSPQLKEFMAKLGSGEIKPRSASSLLSNLVKNEAERAYVLKHSTHNSVSAAARALKLSADGATIRGASVE